MKGSLNRFVQQSSNGVLHDAANKDAGASASLPVPIADAGDLSRYMLCSRCFPKAEKVEAEAGEEKVEDEAVGATEPEKAEADSGNPRQAPAKRKGAR